MCSLLLGYSVGITFCSFHFLLFAVVVIKGSWGEGFRTPPITASLLPYYPKYKCNLSKYSVFPSLQVQIEVSSKPLVTRWQPRNPSSSSSGVTTSQNIAVPQSCIRSSCLLFTLSPRMISPFLLTLNTIYMLMTPKFISPAKHIQMLPDISTWLSHWPLKPNIVKTKCSIYLRICSFPL